MRIIINVRSFIIHLRVNESHPAELGQHPEASLAWGGVTWRVEK